MFSAWCRGNVDRFFGELRRESAEAKAERIISEELRRLGWSAADLSPRRKSDPAKLALANRLKRETIPLVKAIAERLHFGSSKSARERLRESKAACECQSSLLTRFCEQDKQFGMPRKPRLEYLGAIYHVMNRGDRREDIFRDEQDREKFLRTLTEACLKTEWQLHAYCLMGNHFHLVIETPQANLVSGMNWPLGVQTRV